MTGWLISVLDRLSPSARRVAVVAVALLALGTVIAAVTLTPAPPGGAARRRAPARTAAKEPSIGTAKQRLPPPVSAAGLLRARRVAVRFLDSYLAFAYGRAGALGASALTLVERRELGRGRARITPVERRRRPRVVSLRVVGMTPGFVLATAIVKDGGITAYPLRFTLQARAGGWAVSGVEG